MPLALSCRGSSSPRQHSLSRSKGAAEKSSTSCLDAELGPAPVLALGVVADLVAGPQADPLGEGPVPVAVDRKDLLGAQGLVAATKEREKEKEVKTRAREGSDERIKPPAQARLAVGCHMCFECRGAVRLTRRAPATRWNRSNRKGRCDAERRQSIPCLLDVGGMLNSMHGHPASLWMDCRGLPPR